jgi:hypothetical protein
MKPVPGYCESCDRWTPNLFKKGARWLCKRCLGGEL